MSLGENVKRLRRDKGLTQGELSTLCEIKTGHISKIENDESDPKLSTIYKLMKALDCSPNALLMDGKEVGMSTLLAATLERADKLDDASKRTIIDIVDHYVMAKGMQALMKDRGNPFLNLGLSTGDMTPVLKDRAE